VWEVCCLVLCIFVVWWWGMVGGFVGFQCDLAVGGVFDFFWRCV